MQKGLLIIIVIGLLLLGDFFFTTSGVFPRHSVTPNKHRIEHLSKRVKIRYALCSLSNEVNLKKGNYNESENELIDAPDSPDVSCYTLNIGVLNSLKQIIFYKNCSYHCISLFTRWGIRRC